MSDPEVNRLITSVTSESEVLRLSAPLFSTLFLVDLLDRVLDPKLPQLTNNDGEEMEFIALVYRLLDGVMPERIRAALDQAPDLDAASPTFWNWLAPKDAAPKQRTARKGKALGFMSTMGDGSIVLGTIELKARTLELHVNSESRAERGSRMIEALLGGLVGAPLMERQTIEQVLAERPDRGSSPKLSGLAPEEERQIIHAAWTSTTDGNSMNRSRLWATYRRAEPPDQRRVEKSSSRGSSSSKTTRPNAIRTIQ